MLRLKVFNDNLEVQVDVSVLNNGVLLITSVEHISPTYETSRKKEMDVKNAIASLEKLLDIKTIHISKSIERWPDEVGAVQEFPCSKLLYERRVEEGLK